MMMTCSSSEGWWYEMRGVNYRIALEPRTQYCDRGNWIAKIDTWGDLELDGQDGWPRYYFALERARLEVEAWLTKRGLGVREWQLVIERQQ